MIVDKGDFDPPADWVVAELIDADNRVAMMVGWQKPGARDGVHRHSNDWDVDEFSRETCKTYFQAWVEKNLT